MWRGSTGQETSARWTSSGSTPQLQYPNEGPYCRDLGFAYSEGIHPVSWQPIPRPPTPPPPYTVSPRKQWTRSRNPFAPQGPRGQTPDVYDSGNTSSHPPSGYNEAVYQYGFQQQSPLVQSNWSFSPTSTPTHPQLPVLTSMATPQGSNHDEKWYTESLPDVPPRKPVKPTGLQSQATQTPSRRQSRSSALESPGSPLIPLSAQSRKSAPRTGSPSLQSPRQGGDYSEVRSERNNTSKPDELSACTVKTCVSCADDLPATDFPSFRFTQSCAHENSTCLNCVKQWIETRVSDGSWKEIKCPECDKLMQYADVQLHADSAVFERYDMLTARSWLNDKEDFVWCRSCDSGQVHEGGNDAPLFQCVACGSRYCIVHEVPWHEGETCSAFDRRMNGQDEPHSSTTLDSDTDEDPEEESDGEATSLSEALGAQHNPDRRRLDREGEQATGTPESQIASDFDAALALHIAENGSSPPMTPRRLSRVPPPFTSNRELRSESSRNTSPSPLDRDRRHLGLLTNRSRQRSPDRHRSMFRRRQSREDIDHQTENDERLARMLQEEDSDEDSTYARNLQARFEKEEKDRLAAKETVDQLRTKVAAQARALKEQLAKADAAAAKRLHESFEQEDKEQRKKEQQEREAYQRRKREEAQGEQTVRTNAKQCPRCGWYIQKNAGCDHMTCFKCKHEFCYGCLANYRSPHKAGCASA